MTYGVFSARISARSEMRLSSSLADKRRAASSIDFKLIALFMNTKNSEAA